MSYPRLADYWSQQSTGSNWIRVAGRRPFIGRRRPKYTSAIIKSCWSLPKIVLENTNLRLSITAKRNRAVNRNICLYNLIRRAPCYIVIVCFESKSSPWRPRTVSDSIICRCIQIKHCNNISNATNWVNESINLPQKDAKVGPMGHTSPDTDC